MMAEEEGKAVFFLDEVPEWILILLWMTLHHAHASGTKWVP